jgi:hypothetical protein
MRRKFDASKMASRIAADRAIYKNQEVLICDDDYVDSAGRVYYTVKAPYKNEYWSVRCDRLDRVNR